MLISKSEVKEYIGYTDTDIDDAIDNIIARVNNEVLNLLGQQVESTTTDVYVSGVSNTECLLVNSPITAINSLSYRATPLDSWSTVSSSDYALKVKDGLTYWVYYNSFSSSYEYKINITYGYDSVPEAVKGVAIDMTVDKLLDTNLVTTDQAGRHGLSSRVITINGDSGTTVYKNSTASYLHRLAPYQVLLSTYD